MSYQDLQDYFRVEKGLGIEEFNKDVKLLNSSIGLSEKAHYLLSECFTSRTIGLKRVFFSYILVFIFVAISVSPTEPISILSIAFNESNITRVSRFLFGFLTLLFTLTLMSMISDQRLFNVRSAEVEKDLRRVSKIKSKWNKDILDKESTENLTSLLSHKSPSRVQDLVSLLKTVDFYDSKLSGAYFYARRLDAIDFFLVATGYLVGMYSIFHVARTLVP